jgi:hypothetical protein
MSQTPPTPRLYLHEKAYPHILLLSTAKSQTGHAEPARPPNNTAPSPRPLPPAALYPNATQFERMQWTVLNSAISLLGYWAAAALVDKPWYGRCRMQVRPGRAWRAAAIPHWNALCCAARAPGCRGPLVGNPGWHSTA